MSASPASVVRNLYVHVPFCARKCEYCAFYSRPADGELINRYIDAVIAEMKLVAHELQPQTVFFGGGTPSILSLKQWEKLLLRMDDLGLIPSVEWTIESNPATISMDKAKLLRSFKVNRISMGVQTLDAKLLDLLGRVHSREMVFRSYDVLRGAGFENINIDLMFAIPGQTAQIWKQTLSEVFALESEHISCYEVIYEQDTPLFDQLRAGRFEVDENLACDMYELLVDMAAAQGFEQYEIANWARRNPMEPEAVPKLACLHNVNYWRGGSFHGLGPSATGYVRGCRTRNWSNTEIYCCKLEEGTRAIEYQEQLEPLARAGETAAFGLRMNRGWSFAEFLETTGYDLRAGWAAEIEELLSMDLARINGDRFQLTRRGLRFADSVAEKFIRISG
jgi:oxygen-independent coproporphyrinogen III oxidase